MISFKEEKLMRMITIGIGLLFIFFIVLVVYSKNFTISSWIAGAIFLIVYIGGPISDTILMRRLGFTLRDAFSFYLYILILPLFLVIYGLMVNVVDYQIVTLTRLKDKKPNLTEYEWKEWNRAYNALINLHDKYAYKYLLEAVSNPNDYIRAPVVIALGNYRDQKVIDILENISGNDPADTVRAEAAKSLAKIRGLGPEAAATQNAT